MYSNVSPSQLASAAAAAVVSTPRCRAAAAAAARRHVGRFAVALLLAAAVPIVVASGQRHHSWVLFWEPKSVSAGTAVARKETGDEMWLWGSRQQRPSLSHSLSSSASHVPRGGGGGPEYPTSSVGDIKEEPDEWNDNPRSSSSSSSSSSSTANDENKEDAANALSSMDEALKDDGEEEWLDDDMESTMDNSSNLENRLNDDVANDLAESEEAIVNAMDNVWDDRDDDDDDEEEEDTLGSLDDTYVVEMTGTMNTDSELMNESTLAVHEGEGLHNANALATDGTPNDYDDNSSSASNATASFTTEAVLDNPAIDENDSSTYVDRLDLADAYDEDVALDTDVDIVPLVSISPEIVTNTPTSSNPESMETEPMVESISDFTENRPLVTEIDDETKEILVKELNYDSLDIDAMKPDVAILVAANKLHRPPEGLPTNWRRTMATTTTAPLPANTTTTGKKNLWSRLVPKHRAVVRVLPKVVGIVAMGTLVVASGPQLASMFPSRASKRSLLLSKASTAATTPTLAVGNEESYSIVEDPTDVSNNSLLSTPVEPSRPVESHSKSIKPGSRPLSNEDLDVTWLDKLITAIERRIKAFLQLEI
jgi:hypothetical protein